MSKITNDGLTRSGIGRMLYSCTHMATVDVEGLTILIKSIAIPIPIPDEDSIAIPCTNSKQQSS